MSIWSQLDNSTRAFIVLHPIVMVLMLISPYPAVAMVTLFWMTYVICRDIARLDQT